MLSKSEFSTLKPKSCFHKCWKNLVENYLVWITTLSMDMEILSLLGKLKGQEQFEDGKFIPTCKTEEKCIQLTEF